VVPFGETSWGSAGIPGRQLWLYAPIVGGSSLGRSGGQRGLATVSLANAAGRSTVPANMRRSQIQRDLSKNAVRARSIEKP
jgi:hypothetical protein